MKTYQCDHCNNSLYFENSICLQCGHKVGFDPEKLSFVTLERAPNGNFFDIANNNEYRSCDNEQYGVCNWLIPVHYSNTYCIACQLNRAIPSLSDPANQEKWKKLEVAKHRLIYALLKLNLPVQPKIGNSVQGLQFDFLNDVSPDTKITTGHDQGVITINVVEADEVERVSNKLFLGEKYRTLLGHFRHEIGHYYWDVLIQNGPFIEKYHQLFGDETEDYSDALQRYYQNGAPGNWRDHFITPYATAHPWEDWAESWSHYLHMMDTLETAHAFGIAIRPQQNSETKLMAADISQDPYYCENFDDIIKMWLPLTFAVNSLNRSMGHSDFYPFIISNPVIDKLKFIHEVVLATQDKAMLTSQQ